MGKGAKGADSLQSHATPLALPGQSPVQLDQQTLMQVTRAALHHFAQRHLKVICILRPWGSQVHRHVVVQVHVQPCSITHLICI